MLDRLTFMPLMSPLLLAGCGSAIKAEHDASGDAREIVDDVWEDDRPDGHEEVVDEHAADATEDVPAESPIDVRPDAACVSMGCPIRGEGSCCEGLTEANHCLPGVECPEDLIYCINCGDGACSPHETAYSCPADCPEGCAVDDALSYGCSPIETQICSCIEDPCEPFCDMMRGAQWIDGCSDVPIPGTGDPSCFPFGSLACLSIGTDDEGWYDTQWESEVAVKLGGCQPRWSCEVAW
ncbi:MAG: hypothetical protein JRG91_04975 [Deltaproteobacteria bacterium]|nr:hypothetical protein [Deltaproteobacteria bacterium]